MKKLLAILAGVAFLVVSIVPAAAVTFNWTHSPTPEAMVEGYRLRMQEMGNPATEMSADMPYVNQGNIADNNFTPNTAYEAWLTAFKGPNESGPTNTVIFYVDENGQVFTTPQDPSGLGVSTTDPAVPTYPLN